MINEIQYTGTIPLTDFLANKSPELVKVYKQIQKIVFENKENLIIHVIPQYVAWRKSINNKKQHFVEIHILKNKIRFTTKYNKNMSYAIGEHLPSTHQWSLDYRLYIDESSDIQHAIDIINNSYKII